MENMEVDPNIQQRNEAEQQNQPQAAQVIAPDLPAPRKRANPEPLSLIPKTVGRPLPFVFRPPPAKRLFPAPLSPFNMVCPRAPRAFPKRQSALNERSDDIRKRLFHTEEV